MGALPCSVTEKDSEDESNQCFRRPVRWDLLSEEGEKIAGGGAAEKSRRDFASRECSGGGWST